MRGTLIVIPIFLNFFTYCSCKLSEMKEIQKLRGRPNGVSIVGLALGTKVGAEDEIVGVSII